MVAAELLVGGAALRLRPPVAFCAREALRRRAAPSTFRLVGYHGRSLAPFAVPPASFDPSRPLLLRPTRAAAGSGSVQGDGTGNQHSRNDVDFKPSNWVKQLLDFAVSNFLPIALVSGVILGLLNPHIGCVAHKYSLSKFSTCGIFFISGLTLRSGDLSAAIEAWPAGLFGLGSILLFTPFLSRLILQISLMPRELVTGLAIFCCMPTTLSSGIALTLLVGGNSALALAMTVVSNLLGIIIVPFSLSKLIGAGAGVPVPTEQLLKNLVTTLLVPLVLGKVTRDSSKGLGDLVDRNRRSFSMISAILLSLVPWMQVSRSRSLLLAVEPSAFALAMGLGVILHVMLLVFNGLAVQIMSVVSRLSVFAKKENTRAVILVASQKTLPVLVAVVEQLHGALGESGLLVLPCVAAHIIQIIIDSFLVNMWLGKDRSSAVS